MTKVNFYILQERARDNRFSLACRIAEKAWQQGHRVVIHTDSEDNCRHMDRLLWVFREESFIPHGIAGKAPIEHNPVLISCNTDEKNEHDILINLHSQVPPFFSRFERVIECVDNDPMVREAGRMHYRFYKDRGYPLDTHDIG